VRGGRGGDEENLEIGFWSAAATTTTTTRIIMRECARDLARDPTERPREGNTVIKTRNTNARARKGSSTASTASTASGGGGLDRLSSARLFS